MLHYKKNTASRKSQEVVKVFEVNLKDATGPIGGDTKTNNRYTDRGIPEDDLRDVLMLMH